MARATFSSGSGRPLGVFLAGLLAAPAAAVADENKPCSAGRAPPSLSLVDPGAGSGLYATQELRVKLTRDGEQYGGVRSIDAPGARVDIEGAEGSDGAAALLWIDRPGPLTVTARVPDVDPALDSGSSGREDECTHTVSGTFDIRPASVARAGKLSRPRLVDRARNLWYRRVVYSFSVTAKGPTADRSPLTVRARATRRATYPGGRTRAVSRVYGQREFDLVEQQYRNGCHGALICAPETPYGGYAKAIGVRVEELEGRGLKLSVDVPTSYPRGGTGRTIPTPWGVDVEVFQSGRRIARLRAAGRCVAGGQAARCSFKRASTKP
jgi:hypothetical protein